MHYNLEPEELKDDNKYFCDNCKKYSTNAIK